jgi:glycerol-3-phosphate dehydrogenase (NAD(P)+)
MDILVLGAGAWGTALAIGAGTRHRVTLWARDPAQAAAMAASGENVPYLPGFRLPAGVTVASRSAGEVAALAQAHELVIVATPMAGLREMLTALRGCTRPVAWLCKGFEAPLSQPYGLLGHEVRAEVAPQLAGGVLSGPSFAQEVAQGRPTALVAASDSAAVRDALVAAFHSSSMRIYANEDLPGVEVGGAVKNVLAIACGIVMGKGLGDNARAALITRGLAEMLRLGRAKGAKPETLMGLSGLGDLVLTCAGPQSRNLSLGQALGRGEKLADILAQRRSIAEGMYSAAPLVKLAISMGVDMPIAATVDRIVNQAADIDDCVRALLARPFRAEG